MRACTDEPELELRNALSFAWRLTPSPETSPQEPQSELICKRGRGSEAIPGTCYRGLLASRSHRLRRLQSADYAVLGFIGGRKSSVSHCDRCGCADLLFLPSDFRRPEPTSVRP